MGLEVTESVLPNTYPLLLNLRLTPRTGTRSGRCCDDDYYYYYYYYYYYCYCYYYYYYYYYYHYSCYSYYSCCYYYYYYSPLGQAFVVVGVAAALRVAPAILVVLLKFHLILQGW